MNAEDSQQDGVTSNLPVPTIVINKEGEIVAANELFGRTLSVDPSDAVGQGISDLVDEGVFAQDVPDNFERALELVKDDTESVPFTARCFPDGDEAMYEVRLAHSDLGGYICTFHDVSSTKRSADMMESLHDATRHLFTAETQEEVAQIAADAASDIIGFDGTSVRFYDPSEEVLRYVALGQTVGDIDERPDYDVHDTPHGRAFLSGEPVIEDVKQSEDPYDRGAFVQVMYVPIGDRGTLSAGKSRGQITETERRFAEVLARNTAAALDRTEHITRLEDRNERIDSISSIVTHDLRNAITIAKGYLSAIEGAEQTAVESIGVSLDRMEEITEDLLLLTSRGRDPQIESIEDISRTVDEAKEKIDLEDGKIRTSVGGEVSIRADDILLQRLLAAIMENAVLNDDDDDGTTIEVYPEKDGGFRVWVSGQPFDQEPLEEGHGHGTTTEGAGFEAATIRWIANIHGWEVDLDYSDDGTDISFSPSVSVG